ncbi:MAG: hypothetical protein ACLFMW_10515 [Ectothiorhodospira sp.]
MTAGWRRFREVARGIGVRHPLLSFQGGALGVIVVLVVLGWLSFLSVILLGGG